jgi:hypothetical protein
MHLYRDKFVPLCYYVRMTTGVAFPVQTSQQEPTRISNKPLQSDENYSHI